MSGVLFPQLIMKNVIGQKKKHINEGKMKISFQEPAAQSRQG